MAKIGQFDETLTAKGWFDESAIIDGWFDDSLIATPAGGSSITGTGSITETTSAISASGLEKFTGTSAVTRTTETIASSGLLKFTSTASITETTRTIAASGVEKFTGALTLTESSETISASGAVAGISGTAAITETSAQISATGSVAAIASEEGGGAVSQTKRKRRQWLWNPPQEIKIETKPEQVRVDGTSQIVLSTSSVSARGTNTPPAIIGNSHLIALTPRMVANGSMNTDKIDSELATALLYL